MNKETLKSKWSKAIINPYWWLVIVGYIAFVSTLLLITT